MQGKKRHQPELFSYVDLERIIPPNHLLRKIDRLLDFGFVRGLTKPFYCEDNGRPSIDPETFFRMQVISYLYGICSDRQLCEEVQVNLAYRWFLRMSLEEEVPDHSSLTRIRDRLGEETFKKLFERMVEQCKKAKLVSGKRIIADSTLVEANASMDAMEERENPIDKSHYKDRHKLGPEYREKRTGQVKKRKLSNRTHFNRTDPDSTILGGPGTRCQMYYKAHCLADAKARVITDIHITTGAQYEGHILAGRVEHVLKRFKFPSEECIADKGYGCSDNYEYLRKRGIRAYIPMQRVGQAEGRATKEGFNYDRKNDKFICPRGAILTPSGPPDKKHQVRYSVKGSDCLKCSIAKKCLPPNQQHRGRFIHRSMYDDLLSSVRRRIPTPHFQSKLRERAWKVEGLFAEGKQFHNLERAKYRGRANVQIQAYLIGTVLNLKRLANSLGDDLFRKIYRLLWKILFKLEPEIIAVKILRNSPD